MAPEPDAPDEIVFGGRVVGCQFGDAGRRHAGRAGQHILLQTAAADRADAMAVGQTKQSRARTTVGRTGDGHERGQHSGAAVGRGQGIKPLKDALQFSHAMKGGDEVFGRCVVS